MHYAYSLYCRYTHACLLISPHIEGNEFESMHSHASNRHLLARAAFIKLIHVVCLIPHPYTHTRGERVTKTV